MKQESTYVLDHTQCNSVSLMQTRLYSLTRDRRFCQILVKTVLITNPDNVENSIVYIIFLYNTTILIYFQQLLLHVYLKMMKNYMVFTIQAAVFDMITTRGAMVQY